MLEGIFKTYHTPFPLVKEILSDFASAFKRFGEGHLIGIFQIDADRNTAGNSCDLDVKRLDEAGEVNGGRLPFYIGIRSDNYLRNPTFFKPFHEVFDGQLRPVRRRQRRECAKQNMVEPL